MDVLRTAAKNLPDFKIETRVSPDSVQRLESLTNLPAIQASLADENDPLSATARGCLNSLALVAKPNDISQLGTSITTLITALTDLHTRLIARKEKEISELDETVLEQARTKLDNLSKAEIVLEQAGAKQIDFERVKNARENGHAEEHSIFPRERSGYTLNAYYKLSDNGGKERLWISIPWNGPSEYDKSILQYNQDTKKFT